MKNVFQILKQEMPLTSKPYRIAEIYWTSDGPRTRLTGDTFRTLEEAEKRMHERAKESKQK